MSAIGSRKATTRARALAASYRAMSPSNHAIGDRGSRACGYRIGGVRILPTSSRLRIPFFRSEDRMPARTRDGSAGRPAGSCSDRCSSSCFPGTIRESGVNRAGRRHPDRPGARMTSWFFGVRRSRTIRHCSGCPDIPDPPWSTNGGAWWPHRSGFVQSVLSFSPAPLEVLPTNRRPWPPVAIHAGSHLPESPA